MIIVIHITIIIMLRSMPHGLHGSASVQFRQQHFLESILIFSQWQQQAQKGGRLQAGISKNSWYLASSHQILDSNKLECMDWDW